MLTTLFIFGLLCNTAFPLPDAESNEESANSSFADQKIPCADRIEWIENTILEAKKQFEEYYTQLAKNHINVKNLGDVMTQLDQINRLITDSLAKYTVELDKVHAVTGNATNQLQKVCTEELEKFSIMSQNLSSMIQSFRPTVVDLANKLGLSPRTIDGLDRSLGRMVMFTTQIGNHTVEHTFIKKGVKSIIRKAEEGIVISYTEPTSGIVDKQVNTPEEVPNVATKPVYVEYEDEEDDKAFDDLLHSDKDIEKADKELLEREEAAKLAERQRLADAEKYEQLRQEQIRLKEIKTNEIINSANEIKILL